MKRFNELLSEYISIFSIIFCGSTLAMLLFHLIFKYPTMSIVDFGGLILATFIISFSKVILLNSYSVLTKQRMIVQTVLHFAVVLISLLAISNLMKWTENSLENSILILIIVGTYLVIWSIFYLRERTESKMINQGLKAYKERMKS